jgi:DNA primase
MSDIDDIKSRIDIVEFIGKRVHLKKAGRNFKGLCPFHSEKTPSFMVSADRQAWHCFGCGKGGSVFDFVMEYEHVNFREALEELADLTGVTLTRQIIFTPEERHKDVLLALHHLAAEYFQFLLTSHSVGKRAKEYLLTRGITEKIVQTFGIGYSANSWEGLSKYLKTKGYDEKTLEEAGLLIPSSRGGYDRFRGRLMFPLKNHRGQIIGFSGRLLDPEIKEAKYINSPETAIYKKGETVFGLDITKSAIQKEQSVVVMEGEFDVLSSFQAGISNVVAIKGTALTQQQVYLLKRFAKKIVFALDGDIAGDQASRRGIELAEKAGLEIYVALLPQGKDPDDIARSQAYILRKAIENAQSIYDYYFSSAQKEADVTTAYGKKQISDQLLPILARIENPIIQAHYIKKLANVLLIPEQAVVDGMRKMQTKKAAPPSVSEKHSLIEEGNTQDIYLLALLLQGNPKLLLLEPKLEINALESAAVKHIVQTLNDALHTKPFVLREFLSTLPQEWGRIIDQAMTWDVSNIIESSEYLKREWQMIVKERLKRYYKRVIEKKTQELKQGKEEEDDGIQKEIAQLAQKLHHLEKAETI